MNKCTAIILTAAGLACAGCVGPHHHRVHTAYATEVYADGGYGPVVEPVSEVRYSAGYVAPSSSVTYIGVYDEPIMPRYLYGRPLPPPHGRGLHPPPMAGRPPHHGARPLPARHDVRPQLSTLNCRSLPL